MTEKRDSSLIALVVRIIVTAIVLAISAFLTPWFTIDGIGPLLVASIVIALLVYLIGRFAGLNASPFGRGLVGFTVTVVVLYLTKLIVDGFDLNLIGAVTGALVIGIVDAIIPGKTSL